MTEKKTLIHIVAVNCPLELEEKFNRWYDEKHVPDMIKSGKVKRAARFKTVDTNATVKGAGMPVQYLAVYEFENKDDFAEYATGDYAAYVIKDTFDTWPEWAKMMQFRVQYEMLKAWQR